MSRSKVVAAVVLTWSIVTALVLLALVLPAYADPATVVVEVSRLRSDRGRVRCALFASSDGWTEEGREIARTIVSVRGGHATCTFHEVGAGRYASAILHDEDDDGALDRDLFGFPQEGFGFSNDAAPALGPPSFDAAAFEHEGGETTLRVHARYGL